MVMLTKAGTFDAAIVTGNQVVPGIGFTPKALILYGVGATDPDVFNTAAFIEGLGFTTGPTNSYAQTAVASASSSTGAYRRVEACAFIQANVSATAIIRRADLASFDADGFTLNWTIALTNGAHDTIHYLALGGDDLTGAKAVNWQMPTVTGINAVTGAGFMPDMVMHAHAGGVTTVGGNASTAAALGLGAMTATDQWASGFFTSSTSAHARNQESDKCLTLINSAGTITAQARFASMDADGFSTSFGIAATAAFQVISLCLKGGKYKAGRILKSTAAAPASQPVTGVGFAPGALLLAGVQDISRAAPLSSGGVAYGLGASDGTSEWGAALYGAATATRTNISKTTKVYEKVNNGSKVIDAEADLASMDADGFTLDWTTNDAVETSILYLAIGSTTASLVAVTASDGGTLAAAETSETVTSSFVEIVASDAATITTEESTSVAAFVDTSDSGALAVAEAVDLSSTLPVMDAGTLGATESVATLATILATDAGTIAATDAANISTVTHLTLATSDGGVVTASESGVVVLLRPPLWLRRDLVVLEPPIVRDRIRIRRN